MFEPVRGTVVRYGKGLSFALFALALGWTLFCLKFIPRPFLWLFPAWILVCLFTLATLRQHGLRAVLFNLAVVLAALAIFEAYARHVIRLREQSRVTYDRDYWAEDSVLGVVPKKDIVARAKKTHRDETIYDVAYTIGPDGLRISPPDNGPRSKGCAIFFGCSLTFGEGLRDDQAMPFRVGVISKGDYRIYNFGFHGYGPHHMLAAIEQGIVEQTVQCRPTHVIYQAFAQHAYRAAGLRWWGRRSPRYRLQSDGTVRRDGFFDDGDISAIPVFSIVWEQWRKSYTSEFLESRPRRLTDDDKKRFLAIVKTSARLIRQKFPGCQFDVLFWRTLGGGNELDDGHNDVLDGLRAADFRVHLVEDILPDYTHDPSQYLIGEHDQHPNALADEMIAEYVVREILGNK